MDYKEMLELSYFNALFSYEKKKQELVNFKKEIN